MDSPPIGCNLKALDAAQRERQAALLRRVKAAVQEVREQPDGYAVRLPAGAAFFRDVAEWVALERACCAFLDVTLEWRRDDTVWVTLTGGPGTKDVLAAEMGLGGAGHPPLPL